MTTPPPNPTGQKAREIKYPSHACCPNHPSFEKECYGCVYKRMKVVEGLAKALRTQAQEYEGRIKELEADLVECHRLGQITFDSGKQQGEINSFKYFNSKELALGEKIKSLEALLEEAKEALRRLSHVRNKWLPIKQVVTTNAETAAIVIQEVVDEALQKLNSVKNEKDKA